MLYHSVVDALLTLVCCVTFQMMFIGWICVQFVLYTLLWSDAICGIEPAAILAESMYYVAAVNIVALLY